MWLERLGASPPILYAVGCIPYLAGCNLDSRARLAPATCPPVLEVPNVVRDLVLLWVPD